MSTPAQIRALRRQLTLAYGVSWALSVALLAGAALLISARGLAAERDERLLTHAVAVYGMTWLSEDGVFHDEVLAREAWLVEGGADVRILHRDGRVLFTAAELAISPTLSADDPVLVHEEPVFRGGWDAQGVAYRQISMPAYNEDDDTVYGAIVVSSRSGPFAARWGRLAAVLLLVSTVLVGAGLWLGARLAERSLVPLVASVAEREILLAAAAHELRTPLASLGAILESASAGDEPAEAALPRLQRVVSVATERVGRLMAWARLGADEPVAHTRLRLDLLAEQVIDAQPIPLDAEACVILGDAAALSIALRNLIENAQRHGRPPIRVAVSADGALSVSDSGAGFAEIAAATRPFGARPGSPGSGLGLDIVRRVAAAHGGTLIVENLPGGGARVGVRIPPCPP